MKKQLFLLMLVGQMNFTILSEESDVDKDVVTNYLEFHAIDGNCVIPESLKTASIELLQWPVAESHGKCVLERHVGNNKCRLLIVMAHKKHIDHNQFNTIFEQRKSKFNFEKGNIL